MNRETYDALQKVLEHIRENDVTQLHAELKQLEAWSDEVLKEYDE